MSDAAVREGKNRIMIYGPKDDGTYVGQLLGSKPMRHKVPLRNSGFRVVSQCVSDADL